MFHEMLYSHQDFGLSNKGPWDVFLSVGVWVWVYVCVCVGAGGGGGEGVYV